MDGFVLTHAYERVDLPEQRQVDDFLPPFAPRQVLDPNDPVSIGAMVGPEAFTEVRYLAHRRHLRALEVIPRVAGEFADAFGRESGGLVRPYRLDDADTAIVAMGSVLGTLKDVVDERRGHGERVGVLGITAFRPFPFAEVRRALRGVRRVVVLERTLSVGVGGVVTDHVRAALDGAMRETSAANGAAPYLWTVIAGLGGRPITTASLHEMIDRAVTERLEPLTFLDLRRDLVEREAHRERAAERV